VGPAGPSADAVAAAASLTSSIGATSHVSTEYEEVWVGRGGGRGSGRGAGRGWMPGEGGPSSSSSATPRTGDDTERSDQSVFERIGSLANDIISVLSPPISPSDTPPGTMRNPVAQDLPMRTQTVPSTDASGTVAPSPPSRQQPSTPPPRRRHAAPAASSVVSPPSSACRPPAGPSSAPPSAPPTAATGDSTGVRVVQSPAMSPRPRPSDLGDLGQQAEDA